MKIGNHFNHAKHELAVAQADVNKQDYRGALAALAEAYSHTRALLDHVHKLQALKNEVEIKKED